MDDNSGYRESFKASTFLGGSQGITYALGLVRTKALAYLLGPAGIGLLGLYTSIVGTVGTLSGLGIGESSIREIAAAKGSGNQEKLSRTVKVVRRASLLSGIFGLLLCILLADPLSTHSFGNSGHTIAIAILGFTLLTSSMSAAENALLQGTSRLMDLAKMNIWSSLAGLLPVVLIYVWFRERGIVPALLLSSVVTLAISRYFSRPIPLIDIPMSWREMIPETRLLLSLGFALMLTGLVGTGKDLIVRSMILRNHGIEATGLYQSAWMISGLFANFVLKAMGMDFYPRLTAMNGNRESMIKAINQQIEVGVLLVLPGLIATITCAPLILSLLYSSKFDAGSSLLVLMSCGVFFKMVSYPINTIQLAMGDAKGFASIAVVLTIIELGMTVALLIRFGLIGVAAAFPVTCLFHVLAMAWVGRRLIHYRMKRQTAILAGTGIALMLTALLVAFLLKGYVAFGCGLLLSFLTLCHCVRQLTHRLGQDHRISKLLLKLPFARILVSIDTKHQPDFDRKSR
jgi:antigen flippase